MSTFRVAGSVIVANIRGVRFANSYAGVCLRGASSLNHSSIVSVNPTSSAPLSTHKRFASSSAAQPQHDATEPQPSFPKYDGIAKAPFSKEISHILRNPIDQSEIEIKPDGLIYLPEIKYRRILLNAFGPGGWAMLPLSPPIIERGNLTRTYAIYCLGRYVAESIGEQPYFEGVHSTATCVEAAKSNALVRCCKDLGIASELWDPNFIEAWKRKYALEVIVENVKGVNSPKDRKRLWRRKDRPAFTWPWKEVHIIPQHSLPQPMVPPDSGLDRVEVMLSGRDADEVEHSSPLPHPATPPTPPTPSAHAQAPTKPYQQSKRSFASSSPTPPPPPPKIAVEVEEEAPPPPPPPPPASKKAAKGAKAAPAEPEPSIEFNIDQLVPHQFTRYQGKTWREVIREPKGQAYVKWAAKRFMGDPQQQAIAVVEGAAAKGGFEALAES